MNFLSKKLTLLPLPLWERGVVMGKINLHHLFFGILLLALLTIRTAQAQISRSTTFDDREFCEKSSGVWRQYGNGCADKCADKFDKFSICTQAITFACQCGKGRCWDDEDSSCISISEYKKNHEAAWEEEKKLLEAAKEKRKAAALASGRATVNKFVDNKQSQQSGSERQLANNGQQQNTDQDQSKNQQQDLNKNDPKDIETPTDPITHVPAEDTSNKDLPVEIELPPFFKQKQMQDEIKKQQKLIQEELKKEQGSNGSNKENGSGASATIPALPEIALPN